MNTEADEVFQEIDVLTRSCDVELEKLIDPCEIFLELHKSRGIQLERQNSRFSELASARVGERDDTSTLPIPTDVLETVVQFLRSQSRGVAVKVLSDQKLSEHVIRVIYHSLPFSIRLAVNERNFIGYLQQNSNAVADAIAANQTQENDEASSAKLTESTGKYFVRRGNKKPRGPISAKQMHDFISAGRLLPSDFFSTAPAGPWKKVKLFSRIEPAFDVERLPEGAMLLENVLKLSG